MATKDLEPQGALNGTHEAKKIVGNLSCQKDTYLQHLTTVVCDCQKNSDKKAPKIEQYEIQLLDTILFPEGGGQPWDHGTLSFSGPDGQKTDVSIQKVLRRKLEAIHYAPTPIEVNTKVNISLDFARRFDQAQQHSGQHLLSAVLDQYEIPTLAWTMGPELVYVEVPRLPDDLKEVERKCNEYIRQNLPITVTETKERPKNLPQDYDDSAGVIRVVSIGGIDANPCCGTHVRSTSELNSLTILYSSAVKGAARNNFRIHFVSGQRCQKLLTQVHGDARATAASLSCQISELPDKVTHLQNQLKDLMKRERNLRSEVVAAEAKTLEASLEKSGKGFLHRPTGDLEFLNATLASLPSLTQGVVILVAGEKEGGPIIIAGQEDRVNEISGQVKAEMKSIKGGGKPNKFQGKAVSYIKNDINFLRSLIEK